jgi:hypothetical protein
MVRLPHAGRNLVPSGDVKQATPVSWRREEQLRQKPVNLVALNLRLPCRAESEPNRDEGEA